MMLRAVAMAAACLAALLACDASAQIDPDDTGAGTKLGLTQLDNSGQVGTVTLFAHGLHHTLVILDVQSVPAGQREPARIRRGHFCRTVPLHLIPAVALNDVAAGASRSEVAVATGTLLSGNYLVEVFGSRHGPRRVTCGRLYR